MIPQPFIQELLSRLDIVDVVGRSVHLKKAGANYTACCPFHQEKSPSFTVSPTKQFYHCFGCGRSGDAIGFVMEHQGLAFVDAVEYLAGTLGMAVPSEMRVDDPAAAERDRARAARDALKAVLKQAARFYCQALKTSPRAIQYLKGRGLTGEIAARFGIGYAPNGWNGLKDVFADYDAGELRDAGLVIDNEEGRRYDRFRDRIMFPILGRDGAVIGFGGRVIGDGKPKYLNSPETPLFEKGRELYGLVQARRPIRDAGMALVVEGYMDVVALAQHGIGFAVATLGTATTPVHVQNLFRQTDRVVFCFDGDAAGRKAAWRALENCLEPLRDGKACAFLFLPEEHDPDSYVRACGREAFLAALDQAVPLSRFLLDELARRADPASPEGRVRLLELARPLITRITAPATALLLRKELARLAGIEMAELDALLGTPAPAVAVAEPPAPPPAVERRPPKPYSGRRNQPSLSGLLLRMLLYRPELAERMRGCKLPGNGPVDRALQALQGWLAQEGSADRQTILAHFAGSEHVGALRQAADALAIWGDDADIEHEFSDALVQLERVVRKRESDNLLLRSASGSLAGLSAAEKKRLLELLARPADLQSSE